MAEVRLAECRSGGVRLAWWRSAEVRSVDGELSARASRMITMVPAGGVHAGVGQQVGDDLAQLRIVADHGHRVVGEV